MKLPRASVAMGIVLAGGTVLSSCGAGTPKEPALVLGPAPRESETSRADSGEWRAYGHDPEGTRYSALDQINRANVAQLRVAWTYRTGDHAGAKKTANRIAFQTNPLMVDGTLYLSTPFNRVIALDPQTGKERWTYDPKIDLTRAYDNNLNSRGVTAWHDEGPGEGPCRRRIFTGTNDARLIAIDADTGKPCAMFGAGGQVNLAEGMGVSKTAPGEYQITSPPAVTKDVVIVGSSIGDGARREAPSGAVRAFDARTGKLRWAWDPAPNAKPSPSARYRLGTPNVWSIMSVDAERDLVFLPTGNASPDYYGGPEREPLEKYASSVVALRASTGEVVWSFQTVHHDVWNYDVAAQPSLISVKKDGKDVPAVLVSTKVGHLFLLDRETGKPLFPVEERPVPQDGVPGEKLSPTQPFPTHPPPLAPQNVTPADAWGVTPEDKAGCAEQIKSLRSEGPFTPPSLKGTLVTPGDLGGMNWSGSAFDPARGLVITSTNHLPRVVRLAPPKGFDFEKYRAGRPPNVSLDWSPQEGTPYIEIHEFLLRGFAPCTTPPWGKLVAVDLENGTIKWEVALGGMPEVGELVRGAEKLGSLNLGGAIVTAGGLVFIAASRDGMFRAFDVENGTEVWKAKLPAGGQALPMTYRSREGRQFVVMAAGGHGMLLTEPGDYVVAYTVP